MLASIALTPVATVITNPRLPDNPIIAANAAFQALTGYEEAEIIGRNCRFLSGPDTSEASRRKLRDSIAAGRPILTELLNYRKNGTPFWNALMIAPSLGPGGEVAFFLGSQMDVSAGQKLPTELRRGRAAGLVEALAPRQRQVLERMMLGHRNKQIAAELGINEKTVKMHRAALLNRLGAATTADAIRIGVEAGL